MPTYMLEGDKEARIATGPIRIQVHASGDASFAIVATTNDGKPVDTINPRADIMVIPRLPARSRISVKPASAGSVFSQGTTLNLTLTIDGQASADPERVVLSAVDVSGLGIQELLSLEAQDGHIATRSLVTPKQDDELGGLAKAAQVATREILGVDQVDGTSSVNLVAAVDGSASMLAATRDGSVAALVEVLVGISRVISPGRTISGAIVTEDVAWVESAKSSGLGGELSRAQESRPLGTAFRSAAAGLAGRSANQNTVTYVITDAVPADIAELRAVDEVEGEARHLVVLGEAQAIALEGDPGLATTVVQPVLTEEGVAGRLEFDGQALRQVIKSLLNGCFVPGTDYAKRVAQ